MEKINGCAESGGEKKNQNFFFNFFLLTLIDQQRVPKEDAYYCQPHQRYIYSLFFEAGYDTHFMEQGGSVISPSVSSSSSSSSSSFSSS